MCEILRFILTCSDLEFGYRLHMTHRGKGVQDVPLTLGLSVTRDA
jgi:hypothetical protein